MIRIVKPVTAPKMLAKGVEQTRKDCATYDNSPTDYQSRRKTLSIDSKIFGAKSVKNALLRIQHNKCCYCESKFRHTSYGAVEHYRPKGSVKQAPGQREEYPGYYWLVYDWNNLLVSCEVCNTSYKGVMFPLVDDSIRARSHHHNIALEQPLFLNPAAEHPRDHIRFRGDAPEPITEVGRATIQGLGLQRSDLEENRRHRLMELKRLRDFIELEKGSVDLNAQTLVQRAREHLAAAARPEAEYSSMVRDFLDSNE
jgi:uncharacterized protein (TIGR02646 family)